MKVCFSQSHRELVNSAAHARDCLTDGEKCTFLVGSWAKESFPVYLHNLWVEHLTATQIFINPRLNNLLLGKFVQTLL